MRLHLHQRTARKLKPYLLRQPRRGAKQRRCMQRLLSLGCEPAACQEPIKKVDCFPHRDELLQTVPQEHGCLLDLTPQHRYIAAHHER
jgi:hypothetical protein